MTDKSIEKKHKRVHKCDYCEHVYDDITQKKIEDNKHVLYIDCPICDSSNIQYKI